MLSFAVKHKLIKHKLKNCDIKHPDLEQRKHINILSSEVDVFHLFAPRSNLQHSCAHAPRLQFCFGAAQFLAADGGRENLAGCTASAAQGAGATEEGGRTLDQSCFIFCHVYIL